LGTDAQQAAAGDDTRFDVPAFTAPALLNGWTNFGEGHETVASYRDRNRVFLRGLIANGAVGSTAVILPVGRRPAVTQVFVVISGDAVGRVDITPNGAVTPLAPSSNAWVSLAGLSFRVT
jgi:hypothetical protein